MTLGGRYSAQRKVSRQERRQELDREQWADLDRVQFPFTAEGTGEAYAGQFLFGRAFDAPPFFTYSSVCDLNYPITVGVADWIQDDQEMYVGANLWLKNDSHCIDPIVYGDNILRDPGFELHKGYMPVGPDGEEFVGEFGFVTQQPTDLTWHEGYYINFFEGREAWWEQNQIAWDNIYRSRDPRGKYPLSTNPPGTTNRYGDAPVPAWVVFSNNGRITRLHPPPVPSYPILPRWFISTAEPDVGSNYHARMILPADANDNSSGYDSDLFPIGFEMCRFIHEYPSTNPPSPEGEFLFQSSKTKGFWSARVLPGDTVTFKVRAKSNWGSDPAEPGVLPWLDMSAYVWAEAEFKTATSRQEEIVTYNLDVSYQTFTLQFTVDAGTNEYLGLSAYPYIKGGPGEFQQTTAILDVDNCSLSIEPGPGNEAKAQGFFKSPLLEDDDPNYEIDVRFEGLTLKSYAAIHHVEKKTAPEHVVLS